MKHARHDITDHQLAEKVAIYLEHSLALLDYMAFPPSINMSLPEQTILWLKERFDFPTTRVVVPCLENPNFCSVLLEGRMTLDSHGWDRDFATFRCVLALHILVSEVPKWI